MKFSSLVLLACSLIAQPSAAYQPNLRKSSKDDPAKCFDKCFAEKAKKIESCQAECVVDEESNGRTRSSIGPSGADELLDCGGGCARSAEKKVKKETKKNKCKCDKDDKDCKKQCKDDEKSNKKSALKSAEKDYKKCNSKCFKEKTLIFTSKGVEQPQPYVRSTEEDIEKCFVDCGKKDPDDADKIKECQGKCVDEATGPVGINGPEALLQCGAGCAEEAEKEYDDEKKDGEEDAEDEAVDEYKDCLEDCFEPDASFQLASFM